MGRGFESPWGRQYNQLGVSTSGPQCPGCGVDGDCENVVNPLPDDTKHLRRSFCPSNHGYNEDPSEVELYDRMLPGVFDSEAHEIHSGGARGGRRASRRIRWRISGSKKDSWPTAREPLRVGAASAVSPRIFLLA
jgi:hypothetical protein